MHLDPQQHLAALEQSLRQLRWPYGDRTERLQQLKVALGQAELALANVRPGDAAEAPQVLGTLMCTIG
jgi:branched-subunit amino acid aminotransferase/4-amino-4-deoxychorismate lyase